MPGKIRITHVFRQTQAVAIELQRLHRLRFRPLDETWQPPINAYRYEDRLELVVDLAGVRREEVDIAFEPRRIIILGTRKSPEQMMAPRASACRQILMMEIDTGAFRRVLSLPCDIDTRGVTVQQREGLLWIQLPIRT